MTADPAPITIDPAARAHCWLCGRDMLIYEVHDETVVWVAACPRCKCWVESTGGPPTMLEVFRLMVPGLLDGAR